MSPTPGMGQGRPHSPLAFSTAREGLARTARHENRVKGPRRDRKGGRLRVWATAVVQATVRPRGAIGTEKPFGRATRHEVGTQASLRDHAGGAQSWERLGETVPFTVVPGR